MIRYDQVPAEWLDRALDVNLRGVMYGTRVALEGMLAQNGGQNGGQGVGAIYNTVGFVLTSMTIEENLRIRERVGEAQWRKIRWVMNAVADSPKVATPWLVERILASLVTRPDPVGGHGL